jgi:hypothetical protein
MHLKDAATGRAAAVSELSDDVGRFHWDIVADTWWWSNALYVLYGYEPYSVEPALDRFLQHKHPADMARIDSVFARSLSQGGPFSCYHRIIDARGAQRTVVVVGAGDRDVDDTRTVALHGFMVDVTGSDREATKTALEAVLRTRAGIEQVKGALMLVHGLDADAAFDILVGHSQAYNRKLSALVADLLLAFRQRSGSESITPSQLDQMLWDAAHPTEHYRTTRRSAPPA